MYFLNIKSTTEIKKDFWNDLKEIFEIKVISSINKNNIINPEKSDKSIEKLNKT